MRKSSEVDTKDQGANRYGCQPCLNCGSVSQRAVVSYNVTERQRLKEKEFDYYMMDWFESKLILCWQCEETEEVTKDFDFERADKRYKESMA